MPDDDLVRVEAEPLQETEKALRVLLTNWGDELWIPKSVIHDDSEVYSMKSGAGRLVVAGWWARQNGLEGSDEP